MAAPNGAGDTSEEAEDTETDTGTGTETEAEVGAGAGSSLLEGTEHSPCCPQLLAPAPLGRLVHAARQPGKHAPASRPLPHTGLGGSGDKPSVRHSGRAGEEAALFFPAWPVRSASVLASVPVPASVLVLVRECGGAIVPSLFSREPPAAPSLAPSHAIPPDACPRPWAGSPCCAAGPSSACSCKSPACT